MMISLPLSNTGVITVREPGASFDRELVSRHFLTVEARDDLGKGNRNTAQLLVNIEDVNDNAPAFLQNKYEAVLLENEENFDTPVAVEAFDIDLNGTRNSEIVYAILPSEHSDNFTVEPRSGVVKPLAPMDFEALGRADSFLRVLRLTIRATDRGLPSLSSDVPLVLYFKDVNDNAPQFERPLYRKNVPEDSPGGTSILQVFQASAVGK
jgi:cadherin 23